MLSIEGEIFTGMPKMYGFPFTYLQMSIGVPIFDTRPLRYPRVLRFIHHAVFGEDRYAESRLSSTFARSVVPMELFPLSLPPVLLDEAVAVTGVMPMVSRVGIKPLVLLTPFPVSRSAPTPRAIRSAKKVLASCEIEN